MSEDNPFEGLAEKLRGEAFSAAMERVRELREPADFSSKPPPRPSLAPTRLIRRSALVQRDSPEASRHALQVLTLAWSWGPR